MTFDHIPAELDFDVAFAPTRMANHKYVINVDTDEPVGIVGKDFKCASHGDFLRGVQSTLNSELDSSKLDGARVTFKTARNNAFAMMDITLPSVTRKIVTRKHETEVAQRIIALHGVDGGTSNQVFFGAIDFFCTNGMIVGDYSQIRRKNTSGFSLNNFIAELHKSQASFNQAADQLNRWASIELGHFDVLPTLQAMLKSERKAEKMYELYSRESGVRGANLFALYSAFTNYATYADERNGFALRKTRNDTEALSMWTREHEVTKLINSPEFKQMERIAA